MKYWMAACALAALATQAMAWPEKSPETPKASAAGVNGPAALAKSVDAAVAAKCKESGIALSPRSSDAEFLRRAYLDLVGKIPTVAEYHEAMGIVNKDGAAIYKYMNFNQIDEYVENAKGVAA